MSDPDVPRFRVSNEGEPIPAVDPKELKRRWNTRKERLTCDATRAAQSQEADRVAVSHRFRMISLLESFNRGQHLAPWKQGEELDDAVFRVAATFPMRPLRQDVYKVPGDSVWGFDPNAFVEKLIEETGISHTWKPVIARIPEDNTGCTYSIRRVTFEGQAPPNPEQEAKHDARDLLWAVWSKCQPNLSRGAGKLPNELASMTTAIQFADFAIDNIDLAREFVSSMSGGGEGRPPLEILLQLERRAQWSDFECPTCHRLLRDHSDDEMVKCFRALPPGSTVCRPHTP